MTQEMVVISGSADPLIVNIVITYVSIEHNHVYCITAGILDSV